MRRWRTLLLHVALGNIPDQCTITVMYLRIYLRHSFSILVPFKQLETVLTIGSTPVLLRLAITS